MNNDDPAQANNWTDQEMTLAEILNGYADKGNVPSMGDEGVAIDLGEEIEPPSSRFERGGSHNFSRPEMEEMEAAGDLVTAWGYTLRRLGATSATLGEGIVAKTGSLRRMVGISQILAVFEDGDERREVRIFLRAVPGWGFHPGPAPSTSMVDDDGNYVEVKHELLADQTVAKGRAIVCFHGDFIQADAWQPSDRILCCVGRPDEELVREFLTDREPSRVRPANHAAQEVAWIRHDEEIDPEPRHESVEPKVIYTEHPRWRSKMLEAVERLARAATPDIDRIQQVMQSLEEKDEGEDDIQSRILNITARLLEVSDEIARLDHLSEVDRSAPEHAKAHACLTRCLAEIERAVGLDEALLEPLHGGGNSPFDDMRHLSQNMARGRFEHAMTLMDSLVAGLRDEIGWHSGYASQEAMMLLVAAEQALVLREGLARYNADDPRLDIEIRSKTAARAFREAGLKPLLSVAAAMGRSEMMSISGIGDVTMKRVLSEIEATGAPSVLKTSFEADSYSIDERIRSGIACGALRLDGKLGSKLRPDAALAATAVLRKSAYGAGGLRATMIDELARDRVHDLLLAIEKWRRSEPRRRNSPEYRSKFSRGQDEAF